MKSAEFKFDIAENVRQHTTQTYLNELPFILLYLRLKNIFTLKKSSAFTNLLMEKSGIDLLHLFFL